MKYCKNCNLKLKEPKEIVEAFVYCPYCATTLIDIVELESGLYQITPLEVKQ